MEAPFPIKHYFNLSSTSSSSISKSLFSITSCTPLYQLAIISLFSDWILYPNILMQSQYQTSHITCSVCICSLILFSLSSSSLLLFSSCLSLSSCSSCLFLLFSSIALTACSILSIFARLLVTTLFSIFKYYSIYKLEWGIRKVRLGRVRELDGKGGSKEEGNLGVLWEWRWWGILRIFLESIRIEGCMVGVGVRMDGVLMGEVWLSYFRDERKSKEVCIFNLDFR